MSADQRTLFEAEAFAAVERALGHVRATAAALEPCNNALNRGNSLGTRDLGKVIELHRLAGVRIETFVRRFGEGRLSDAPAKVRP